jgi:hypothetical protein
MQREYCFANAVVQEVEAAEHDAATEAELIGS